MRVARALIGGEWSAHASDVTEVRDPADLDRVVATVPSMSPDDVTAVYDHAVAGARTWARVLGTVTGHVSTVGTALLGDVRLAAVSFTGSTAVGMELRRTLADRHVRLQTEMGGKNATAVLADADVEVAAQTIAAAAFGQAGPPPSLRTSSPRWRSGATRSSGR